VTAESISGGDSAGGQPWLQVRYFFPLPGFREMKVSVAEGNEEVIPFYEKLGFIPQVLFLRLR
jgi:hypothetical protein